MRGFRHRIALLALVLLLLPGVVSLACGVTVELDKAREGLDEEAGTVDRTREIVVAGVTSVIAVRTLYAIYLTVPITDCFVLSCDIRILGGPWDNDLLLPLQPMSKLVWNLYRADDTLVAPEDPLSFADAGICRFVASGIFRATESGDYRITVTYRDERLEAPVVQELLVRAE
jgi:hypothetical protein